ncbi:YiiX/YebB-like N1pC/P60 family cysteine hydrolase [Geobacillus stearothermophilus]|nr:YiiX/YebB-like N1pC/P60 family cysteine hydrolase [Geobacillus stearothermophilus]
MIKKIKTAFFLFIPHISLSNIAIMFVFKSQVHLLVMNRYLYFMKKSFLLSSIVALGLISTSGVPMAYAQMDAQVNKAKIQIEQEMEKKQREERQEIINLINEPVDQEAVKKEIEWMKKNAPDKYNQIISGQQTKGVSALASSGALGTNGDILITYDSESSGWNHGHAAIVRWDGDYIIEAWPGDGVRYYVNNWKIRFKTWKALWVKGAMGEDYTSAQSYARAQIGEPYSLTATKNQSSKWYCSLLVWKAWENRGFDLDDDGGIIVTPSDLDQDPETITYASSN